MNGKQKIPCFWIDRNADCLMSAPACAIGKCYSGADTDTQGRIWMSPQSAWAQEPQCVQGGDEWQSGRKKQLLALGSTEMPPQSAWAQELQCIQGGDEWQSGRKKQILALGSTEMPTARRVRALTPLEGARAALALTAAPRSMPCREQERAEILHFVEEAVAAGEHLITAYRKRLFGFTL